MKKCLCYLTASLSAVLFAGNIYAADSVSINVTGKVIASPCKTLNGGSDALNVDLGQSILANSLEAAGTGSAMTAFDLPVTGCPASTTNVKVTFTGTPDATDATMWANNATKPATNTAVELSQQTTGTILSNNSSLTGAVEGGNTTFKLQARVYSKAGAVMPGDVSSAIVASFEYQ
ncbi:type 1 fimbrial protein [Leclercia adecarboxylata]|uniref:Fimbrial protein n=1 Tax=Leclercia adecarboxylata TaxID=83655 RepID=A0A9X3YCX5_9ENTR|nr:fimbrial protein [Leclercia adecarboxylata]MBD1403494.1 type 1 fimbrial protein [Leclercia adecarboxylata]MDC6621122.1 type 1 fimbrial protein [Leclercia adecarboxylata]MDC6631697.1 type 1 fimbrial protein [Leclercia adecarboxylata]MDC6640487.1 type 1 fimbrial protein [Leclercia adecarboxylata]MDC6651271.1 type 1 fimbrial protein [Leclercia adecarboxylata]